MRRGAPEHPKVFALAEALGVRRAEARGLLETFWHWTARYATDGGIGRFTDAAIERGADWEGQGGELIRALLAVRLIDADDVHRLVVHDWSEHADDVVHQALARAGRLFANGARPKLHKIPKHERAELEVKFAQRELERAAMLAERSASAQLPLTENLPSLTSPSLTSPSQAPEGEHAPDGAPPPDPEKWIRLLSKEPGTNEEKRRFLERELGRIRDEAIAALPADRRDSEAIAAKTRSLIVSWYKQTRKPRAGRRRSGRVAGAALQWDQPETSA